MESTLRARREHSCELGPEVGEEVQKRTRPLLLRRLLSVLAILLLVALSWLGWPPQQAPSRSPSLAAAPVRSLPREGAHDVPTRVVGVEADVASSVLLDGMAGGGVLRLVRAPCDGGLACGEVASLHLPPGGGKVGLPPLGAGIYLVQRADGSSAGYSVVAAVAQPPRPLALEPGAVLSFRSLNFPDALLRAAVGGVTISGAGADRAGRGRGRGAAETPSTRAVELQQSSFRVHAAAVGCGRDASGGKARRIALESCERPGHYLAHAGGSDSPLRLAVLDKCDARREWSPMTPALASTMGGTRKGRTAGGSRAAAASTLSLAVPDEWGGRAGRASHAIVARHAHSKLLTSRASISHPDPLLANDASWSVVRAAGECKAATGSGPSQLLAPSHRATLTISIGGAPLELPIDLFGAVAPRTVDNFVHLCRGARHPERERKRGRDGASDPTPRFAGSTFHRIISEPLFMAQGGNTQEGMPGRQGDSAFGGAFADETFALGHDAAGTLSMANSGEDTNNSQFFITFTPTPHLDGKHVVFGRVAPPGLPLLKQLSRVGSRSGKPSARVEITACSVHDTPVK